MTIKTLITISRPRFWIYLLGPVLLGAAAASTTISDLDSIPLLIITLYFTFPANLFIYGINDIHDYDTDQHNDKKSSYEHLLSRKDHPKLRSAILFTNLPFLITATTLNLNAGLMAITFVALAYAYSAPPLRTKARPFLDMATNTFYALPSFITFYALAGPNAHIPTEIILASFLWTMAMHAFSAVPDTVADKKAGIQTIATRLGELGTIIMCAGFYLSSAILTYTWLGWVSILLGATYLTMMAIAAWNQQKNTTVFTVYKAFPAMNTLAGMILFFSIAAKFL